MQCPFCGADNDKVIDSRSSEGGRAVRRRRQCLRCNRRYTTYERTEEGPRLTVVKKDGSRVPYERQKVLAGLQKACYKRPVTDEQMLRIVEAVEEDIYRRFEKQVPSTYIGDAVSEHLRRTDKIAYIRFASVYRQFQDVGEFIEKAQEVRDAPADDPGQGDLFDRSKTDQAGPAKSN
jgi:transcriptional repressor NrdR